VWVPETRSWPCYLGFRGRVTGVLCPSIGQRDTAIRGTDSLETAMPARAIIARERPAQNATAGFPAPTPGTHVGFQ
jgi:hypothetical protein